MVHLPVPFVEAMQALLGEEYAAFEASLHRPPPVSVRVNDKVLLSPSACRVPWCEQGYYLEQRPVFTLDPLFHAGAYYVQEAASMFLARAVCQHAVGARRALDLCAAPGGKSTLLTQCLAPGALLVSNELLRSRVGILDENMTKWGSPGVVVTNSSPADFSALPGWFDLVVVDAPCSGEGMFRKDARAIDEWTPKNVAMCASRQRDIVAEAWETLKPGGVMVYCTCTFNRRENEENVLWMCNKLGAQRLPLSLDGCPGVVETDGGYRFFPHLVKAEGFFLSVMRKHEEITPRRPLAPSSKKGRRNLTWKGEIPLPLRGDISWEVSLDGDRVEAFPAPLADDMHLLKRVLRVVRAGVTLGQRKGVDFIPSAVAALSKALDTSAVESVNVDCNTALAYLRRDNVPLPRATKGYVLLNYEGVSLGWMKNLGNRSNNLYPQAWRIRMQK